jgi:hypothetical protein
MGRPINCGNCKKPKRPKGKKFRKKEGYCECGRPTVMDEKTLGKLEAAFMIALSDVKACAYAGIDPTVLYDYQKENPAYTKRKEQLKQMLGVAAQQTIATAIKKNPSDAWRYLEKTDPEFIPKSKLELGGSVEIADVGVEQSPEEKVALGMLREARRKRIENQSKDK